MPTILVPIDYSDCTRDVLAQAERLAAALGADIELMHIVQLPPEVPPGAMFTPTYNPTPRTAIQHLCDAAQKRLEGLRAVVSARGFTVKCTLEVGGVSDMVVKHAEETSPDFIVMGTHGRRGIGRLMLGSVTESVIRSTPCPVVVTRFQHHEGCAARSCTWCIEGLSDAQHDVEALALG